MRATSPLRGARQLVGQVAARCPPRPDKTHAYPSSHGVQLTQWHSSSSQRTSSSRTWGPRRHAGACSFLASSVYPEGHARHSQSPSVHIRPAARHCQPYITACALTGTRNTRNTQCQLDGINDTPNIGA